VVFNIRQPSLTISAVTS